MKESEALKLQSDKASDEITATRIEKNKRDSSEENISTLLNRLNSSILEFNEQIEAKTIELSQFESEKIRLLAGNDNVEERTSTLTAEKEELEEYIMRVTAEKAELSEKIEEMTKQQLAFAENLNAYQDQKYQQEIKLAKNETQLDTFKEKLWEEFEISYLQAMSFKKDDFVMSTAQKESRDIKNRMRELGDVNVGSIQEYAQVKERYDFLSAQKKDITSAMDQLKAIVDDMEKTIKTRFKENFDKIVINFEGIFKALFGGGHAELRLDNEDNPLESGIEIIAQPPGKKLQNINLMSGGEKTMTAIALMFAVLKTTPTPFCILDEVEAALDDHNIDRFAKYLRKFHDIQFAIVTHQKVTMEHADVLYGVTMPEQGISKVLSLRLGDNFDLG
jgi:chromosome segregation protein